MATLMEEFGESHNGLVLTLLDITDRFIPQVNTNSKNTDIIDTQKLPYLYY